jgi:hypothetical protein
MQHELTSLISWGPAAARRATVSNSLASVSHNLSSKFSVFNYSYPTTACPQRGKQTYKTSRRIQKIKKKKKIQESMTDSRWMCKSIMYTELRGKLFSHPTLLVSMPGPLGSPMPRTSVTKQVSSSHLRTDLSQHFFKHLLSTYGVPSTVVGTRMHKMELLTCLLVGKAERKHHTQSGQ